MVIQQFVTTEVLKLEVEDAWAQLPNLILNPSGRYGGWGWVYATTTTEISGGPPLRLVAPVLAELAVVHSDLAPVAPDATHALAQVILEATIAPTTGLSVSRAYYDADRNLIEVSNAETRYGPGALNLPAEGIAAGTKFVRLLVQLVDSLGDPAAGDWVDFTDVLLIAGTAAEVAAYIPEAERDWIEILGHARELGINRQELDLGTLTGTILSSNLDPAKSTVLRKGKRCRLSARVTPEAEWSLLFTGKLTLANVAYELLNPDESKRARIAITATDAAGTLASLGRTEGVATLEELPWVLRGANVPWNVNGSSAPVVNATIVARNENASALDQIAIARDSVLGYAWVDRFGVLQAWDADEVNIVPGSAGGVTTLDEDDYRDIDLGYDTDRLINEIKILSVQLDPATGETTEVTLGPYRDEASMRQWDAATATYTVYGILDEPAARAYAESILAANSQPEVRATSVTIPIRTVASVANTLIDLYDVQRIVNARAEFDQDLRVVGVEHAIDTKGWLMTLRFASTGTVAPPQVTPSPPVGEGGKTLSQLLQPIGHVEMFYGAKADIAPGWLALDGSTFDGETYPRLATHLGGTTLPNFTDRFPIGAGTKALGTIGGAATHTHGTPNHTHTDNFAVAAHNVNPDEGPNTGTANRVTTGTHTITGGVTSSGAGTTGTPSEGLPPWRALWFIIRAT